MTENEKRARYYEAMAESCSAYAVASERDARADELHPDDCDEERAAHAAAACERAATYRQSAENYARLARNRTEGEDAPEEKSHVG